MKYIEDKYTKGSWIRDLLHGMDSINNMIFDYERDIIAWKLDQITPVQIFEITQHFWKNFLVVCKTRWRRDIGIENEEKFDNQSIGNSMENQIPPGYSNFDDHVFSNVKKLEKEMNPFENYIKER